MPKSIFDPTQPSASVGGLDNFTLPTGHAFSQMPDALIDGKAESDEDSEESEEEQATAPDAPPVGEQIDDAVHEIAEVLDERRHEEPEPAKRYPSDVPD